MVVCHVDNESIYNHFLGKNKKSKKAKLETESSADESNIDEIVEPVEKVRNSISAI
jgi:hypothetical protein